MDQKSNTDHRDREKISKIGAPDNNTTDGQQYQTNTNRPIDTFLTQVILTDITDFFISQNFTNISQPYNVVFVDKVMFEISEEHKDKQNKHH